MNKDALINILFNQVQLLNDKLNINEIIQKVSKVLGREDWLRVEPSTMEVLKKPLWPVPLEELFDPEDMSDRQLVLDKCEKHTNEVCGVTRVMHKTLREYYESGDYLRDMEEGKFPITLKLTRRMEEEVASDDPDVATI
jgi:hypothetical protein